MLARNRPHRRGRRFLGAALAARSGAQRHGCCLVRSSSCGPVAEYELTQLPCSLRHVEYYRGILFLTTNRITTFDEAFLSRIHVALHFSELTVPTKVQIWHAFIKKAGIAERAVSEELIEKLAQRDVNGRQIKNVVRTAAALASSRQEEIGYKHLIQVLDMMEQFETK